MDLEEKNSMESGLPVWQLPVRQSNFTDVDYIHMKAKYHCYCGGASLCGKYHQDTDWYETDIESGEVLSRPGIACKVCFSRWKKNWLGEVNDNDE